MSTSNRPDWLVGGGEMGALESVLAEVPVPATIIGADLRIHYANAAYLALSPGRSLVSSTVDEAWPEAAPAFAERCRQALTTGESFRATDEPYLLRRDDGELEQRYFSWSLHRVSLRGEPEPGLVALVWETTERKRGEEVRRVNEERQRYLLRLTDAIRMLTDPDQILAVASQQLGRHLRVNRAAYATIVENEIAVVRHDYVDGLPSLAGAVPISGFGEEVLGSLRRGEGLVIDDTATDPRLSESSRAAFRGLSIGSTVTIGLLKDERLVGVLAVHDKAPRAWRALDHVLVQETAERTWSALARAQVLLALRQSEERQAFLLTLSDAIRPLDEPAAIQAEASNLLRQQLGADRVCMVLLPGETEHGQVQIVGEDRSSDLPALEGFHVPGALGEWASVPASHRGPRVVFDALAESKFSAAQRAAHRAIGCGAFVTVPVHEGERSVAILAVHQRAPRAFDEADVALAVETAERTWGASSRACAERAVQRSERRLRALIEGIPQLVWRAHGEGQMTWTSPQWTALTGLDPAQSRGRGWLAAVHPDDREGALQAWSTARTSGRLEMEVRLFDADESRHRWFRTRATPVRDPDARIIEWLGTSTDVDELRRLRDHQEVLVAELQHRTRNLMGVIDAIARETIQTSADLEQFATAFRKRVGALSRAQSLLSLGEGQRVTFDTLLHSELDAMFCEELRARITLEGPASVSLRSSSVQLLALALHELATNALKHGALSQSEGRLAVRWWVEPRGNEAWLCIDWRETGVATEPVAAAARRRGQGRMLIERKLPYQLDAKTAWTLTEDGIHCSIEVPFPARPNDGPHPQDPRAAP